MLRTIFTFSNIKIAINSIIIILAIAFYIADKFTVAQFTLACIGLIPLAGIIGDATESLGDLTNEVVGGLLSASFGNAPELIFSIICVVKGFDELVKGSLIGSILGNMLLVLGSSYIIGGLRHGIQEVKYEIVHTAGFFLLTFGSFMFVFPTIANKLNESHVTSISVTISVVFMIIYIVYTYFQLTNLENDNSNSSSISSSTLSSTLSSTSQSNKQQKIKRSGRSFHGLSKLHDKITYSLQPSNNDTEPTTKLQNTNIIEMTNIDETACSINIPKSESPTTETMIYQPSSDDSSTVLLTTNQNEQQHFTQPSNKKRIIINIITLLVASGLIAVLSDIITNNVSEIAQNAGVSQEFVGVIVIAILGNAAEHWTAIYCAYKNRITISITTVESSALQIMMFILPFMNFIGFSRNSPFDFVFTERELAALISTTIIVWLTVADGKTHFLEGFALIGLYAILINVFLLRKKKIL